jgi:type IV secretory pathway VirB10-like protein
MPKYQVLQPIEKASVLYVAKGAAVAKSMPSACHGKLIPVDASGEIELSEEEASILIYGQVPLIQGKPDPVGGAEAREKKAKEDADAAAAKSAAEKAEYEEFVAFRAAKATRKEKAPDAAHEKAQDAAEEEAEDRAEEEATAAKDEAQAAKAKEK